ncbi:hypothetical protein GF374_00995 [Candidatus Woesearchaeota archaeon]|nr:hypothetical protein [Candidatus Woesearchaeota archaeon]
MTKMTSSIPKSIIHAGKDIYVPKEKRKDFQEVHHAKRREIQAAAEHQEYLMDALEKDIENYTDKGEWKKEEKPLPKEDYGFSNYFDPNILSYESKDVEITEKTKKLAWGSITFIDKSGGGGLLKLL